MADALICPYSNPDIAELGQTISFSQTYAITISSDMPNAVFNIPTQNIGEPIVSSYNEFNNLNLIVNSNGKNFEDAMSRYLASGKYTLSSASIDAKLTSVTYSSGYSISGTTSRIRSAPSGKTIQTSVRDSDRTGGFSIALGLIGLDADENTIVERYSLSVIPNRPVLSINYGSTGFTIGDLNTVKSVNLLNNSSLDWTSTHPFFVKLVPMLCYGSKEYYQGAFGPGFNINCALTITLTITGRRTGF